MAISRLFSSVVIYGGVNAFKSLTPLFILPVLTISLSTEQYGMLALIETIILFLTPFISLSLSSAISVEYYRRDNSKISNYISDCITLSLMSLTIFMIISGAMFISDRELPAKILFLIPLFCFLRGFTQVVLTVFRVRQEPSTYAKIVILQSIVELVLSYIFVKHLNFGLEGRVFGVYLSFCIMGIVGLYLLNKLNYLVPATMKHGKEILSYVGPLVPHAVGGVVIALSDRFFISHYLGNSTLGVYSVSYQLSSVMLLVAMSVNQAWSPLLFSMLQKGKVNDSKFYTKILLLLFLLASIAIYLLRDTMYFYFVEISYHEGKKYFLLLLLAFLLQALYFLSTNILFYYRETATLAKITFFTAVLNILLNYLWVVKFQVFGVLASTIVSWSIVCVIVYFVSRRIQKNEENI